MTDMGGICSCDFDGDPIECYTERIVKAKKQYYCCECGDVIKPGDRYERAGGVSQREWFYYKTCLICSRIRKDLCPCIGFGDLKATLSEEFRIKL